MAERWRLRAEGLAALTVLASGLHALTTPAHGQEPASAAADLSVSSAAPGPGRPALDSIFAGVGGPSSPGCALGVIEAGELVYGRGYGTANLDHGIPLDTRSVFYMASVSKQFTAAAVLLAARQGHLSVDDPVRRWVPELPDYGYTLTVRHLLNHTSGLRDYLTLMQMAGLEFGDVFDAQDALDLIIRQRALNFEPGSAYLYSNSGYVLLAEIVARATGRSLREFAGDEIFAPLGMEDTHFHDDPGEVVPRRAMSYVPGGDGDFRLSYLSQFQLVGDGGLHSTVEDMARWDKALSEDLLGTGFAAALEERGVLANGDTIEYALGLNVGERRGLRRVSHGGSMMGFRHTMERYPDAGTTVVVLCNRADVNPSQLAGRVAAAVLDVGPTRAAEGPGRTAPASVAVRDSAATADSARAAEFAAGADSPPAVTPLHPSDVANYAGRYRSTELDATYRLVARGTDLVLIRRRPPDRVLEPDGPDRFRAQGLRFRFARDEQGRITGFVLGAGRVRNLAFERLRDGASGGE